MQALFSIPHLHLQQQPKQLPQPNLARALQVISQFIKQQLGGGGQEDREQPSTRKNRIGFHAFGKQLRWALTVGALNQVKEKIAVEMYHIWAHIIKSCMTSENESNTNTNSNSNSQQSLLVRIARIYAGRERQWKNIAAVLAGAGVYNRGGSHTNNGPRILTKELMNNNLQERIQRQFITLLNEYRISSNEHQHNYTQILSTLPQLSINELLLPQLHASTTAFYSSLRLPQSMELFNAISTLIERESLVGRIFDRGGDHTMGDTTTTMHDHTTVDILKREVVQRYFQYMIEYLEWGVTEEREREMRVLWQCAKMIPNGGKMIKGRLVDIVKDWQKYFSSPSLLPTLLSSRASLTKAISLYFDSNREFTSAITHALQSTLLQCASQFNKALLQLMLEGSGSSYGQQQQIASQKQLSQQQQSYTVMLISLFKLVSNKEKWWREMEGAVAEEVTAGRMMGGNKLSQWHLFILRVKEECGANLVRRSQRMLNDIWSNSHIIYHTVPNSIIHALLLHSDWPLLYNNKTDRTTDNKTTDKHTDKHTDRKKGGAIAITNTNFGSINNAHNANTQTNSTNTHASTLSHPSALANLMQAFLSQLSNSNPNKSFTWLWQYGTIQMSVLGVDCVFSEKQACIITVISNAIRPRKMHQIAEILTVEISQIQSDIDILLKEKIILAEGDRFELNEKYPQEDTAGYRYVAPKNTPLVSSSTQHMPSQPILLQAAIVRLMKKHKSIAKPSLAALLPPTLRTFTPSPEQILQSISKLIRSGMIEVDSSKGILKYIE